MTKFSERSLRLLPTNVLVSLFNSLTLEQGEKLSAISSFNTKIGKLTGVYSIRSPQKGRIAVFSNNSGKSSQEQKQKMIGPSLATNAAVDALRDVKSNPNGDPVYVPGSTEFTPTEDDLNNLTSELGTYFDGQDLQGLDAQSNITTSQLQNLSQNRDRLAVEVKEIGVALVLIQTIIDQRREGLIPNPKLNTSVLNAEVSDRVKEAVDANLKFVENQIIAPFIENANLLANLKAQIIDEDGIKDPKFDLAFGPPVSTTGRYILSEDGLYYDSRNTSSVPTIDSLPVSSNMWDLNFAPNQGGKGVVFTEDDAIETVGTIFDLNANLQVNNRVERFYKFDDVLQQFYGDKQSHMSEVSGYIKEMITNGYAASDATVKSYYQQLGSTANLYDKKIQKRRRQLQIAALFGGSTFSITDSSHPLGEGLIFKFKPPTGKAFEHKLTREQSSAGNSNSFMSLIGGEKFFFNQNTNSIVEAGDDNTVVATAGSWEEIPRIPVNDFSFLKYEYIPIEYQRKLTLFSEDLEDVILPYQPSYVVSPNKPASFKNSIYVDQPAIADWVHRTASSTSVSDAGAITKSLTDNIVTEDLILCYNFLDPGAVISPSSNDFFLNNASEGSTRLDGKMVAYDKSFMFPSGVGIPYLGGTLFDSQGKYSTLFTSVKGSYVRLPNIAKDFETTNKPYRGVKDLENILYSDVGATIESWIHIPRVHSDMTDFHRYRLLLANENSGPVQGAYVKADNKASSKTKGLVIGWRDQGSPENTTGYTTSGLEFVIMPTVGQNNISKNSNQNWGHSVCFAESYPTSSTAPTISEVSPLGMVVTSGTRTSAGSGIAEVSSTFCHLAITFSPLKDEIAIFLNGKSLTTSSLTTVFGLNVDKIQTPTPAVIDNNLGADIGINPPNLESFLGDKQWSEQPSRVRTNLPVFTPWIIGGGYTDSIGRTNGQSYRPLGFLGANTNSVYQNQTVYNTIVTDTADGKTFIKGQHNPPLSSNTNDRIIPRSGLDGHVGSFKIYGRPLTIKEIDNNYEAQRVFFENIQI